MKLRTAILILTLGVTSATTTIAQDQGSSPQPSMALATPGFHHLHLNSTNPEAAIDFYVKNFTSTSKSKRIKSCRPEVD